MNFEFNLKTKTILGKGSILKIIDFVKENKIDKIGLIIDQSLKSNKFIDEFTIKLNESGNFTIINWYYDLPFEPDYISLDEKKLLFKSGESSLVDAIIAIGGGSVIDFAKGISTLITNHNSAITYRGFPTELKPSIPLIAVPTTAGTASEVTYNAVFIDTDSGKKLGINTFNNFPVLAVLDSNMTLSCPYEVALSSGLDALVHTFESFACKKSNIVTRMYAKEAFKLLFSNIELALSDKNNDKARENMLLGSYFAGISLFNSGSGPAGALSYPLGVIFKVPHGIAGGFILPYLIEFNVQNGYDEYKELYDHIFDDNTDEVNKSNRLTKMIFDLYDRLNVWSLAKKYNVDVRSERFQENVNQLQLAFDQNPIDIKTSEGIKFLEKIFG
jgi:alcohol dehydrogenase class IV